MLRQVPLRQVPLRQVPLRQVPLPAAGAATGQGRMSRKCVIANWHAP
jgi:hypothetical protein